MSLRRRITLVFLAVNGVTLSLLLVYVLTQAQEFEDRYERDQSAIRQRTASILAFVFKGNIERDLSRQLDATALDDTFRVMMAISNQEFWDTDPLVGEHLDKAVLVRYDSINTVLFNARPRLVFEHGSIDKNELREKVDGAKGVVREGDGRIVYGRINLASSKKWGFYFRLKYPVDDFDPAASVRAVLFLTIPGAVILLGLLFFIVSRSVLKPLGAMEKAAQRIARGKYDEPVEFATRGDEFGGLARSMNTVMAELDRYRGHMEKVVGEANERFKTAEKHLVIAQRLAAMGKLAAGIAHEINNPLGGLLNGVRKLGDDDLSVDRRKKYLSVCVDAVDRIEGIVSKVLQTTPQDVKLGRVDLKIVLEQALALVGHRLRRESVNVESDIPPGLSVLGSPNELAQVFLNLLINSLDAMDGGTIRVGAEHADDVVIIHFQDEGGGILEENLEQVFDLFFTTKSGGEGTGLGLGIVHNILTGHGGTIDLLETGPDGTVFRLTLPLAPPTAPDVD